MRKFLVFGRSGAWFVFDTKAETLSPIVFPSPYVPENVDVSPNGAWLVFTAYDAGAHNTLMFRWERGSPNPPVLLGDTRGHHADPRISADGRWVFFAHNPLAKGPPMNHGDKAYAQLYRVPIEGGQIESLTDERGCHFSPSSPGGGKVFLVHTSCDLERWIELLDTGTRKKVIFTSERATLDELDLSPDGKRLAYAILQISQMRIRQVDVASRKTSDLFVLTPDEPRIRIRYTGRGREMLYQSNGAIWRFDGTKTSKVIQLQ
ncbi:TolB family protein [Archangium violaceum]|uniref:TolB family protein n=1 Tax=Archangium violaceum TaxID=83451 RepID=UPI0037C04FA2